MKLVCILAIFLTFANANTVLSILTDGENRTLASLENKDQEKNELSILRQMINQETVIRLALVKNFHALISDVNVLKKKFAASETLVSELQKTVSSLQQENTILKNKSLDSQTRMSSFETRLNTFNDNVSSLHDTFNENKKETDRKRQETINHTNGILDDIKVEVRYLSDTLFDFKDHANVENESINKKYSGLEQLFNSSLEYLNGESTKIKNELTNHSTHIQNVDDSQMEMRRDIIETVNKTVSNFETQLKKSEYEQLKLTSAVSSLEVAQLNFTKPKCDGSKRAGFTASVSSTDASWSGNILVFPTVITNVGNAYNPSTGKFTASIPGQYVFFVNVQAYYENTIYVNIVLNGVIKVRTMAYGGSTDRYEAGPNLAVLTLQKDDSVWITRYSGSGYYYDGPITTFSGFLL